MRIQHLIFTLAIITGFYSKLESQDLHIYYDKIKDQVKYEVNGIITEIPKVSKGANVYVHVQNYNNYLFRAKVDVDNVTITLPGEVSGNPFSGLLSMGSAAIPDFNLFDMGISKIKESLNSLINGSESSEDKNVNAYATSENEMSRLSLLRENLYYALEELEIIESDFNVIGKEARKELESKKVRDFALEEIQNLKHNPNLSPNQIKTLAKEYFHLVFKDKETTELSLSELIAMGDVPAQMSKYMTELKVKSGEYAVVESKLKDIERQANGFLNPDNPEHFEFISKIGETFETIESVKEEVNENVKLLERLASDTTAIDLKRIIALREEYELMDSNDFSKTFRVQATGDLVEIKLSFVAIDSSINAPQNIVVSKIQVAVEGGFKIHPSLGLGFGRFINPAKEFHVKDGTIVEDDAGSFSAIITSFLHFYRQSAGGFSFGGAFGVGIPVVSTGSDQSLHFFIGPSFILGHESKIMLSTGIMGGKTNKLGAGYNDGDNFPNDAALLPISSKYEIGYFLGVSYNLGG